MNQQPETTASDQMLHNRVKALEASIDKYGAYIRNFYRSLTKDFHLADDLFQDFWLHVYTKFKIEDFDKVNFLRRKAFHLFVDKMKYQTTSKYRSTQEQFPDVEEPIAGEDSDSEEHEKRYQERFWEQFPGIDVTPQQREAFWLRHRQGFTIVEISGRLKVPVSTIHGWISHVRDECAKSWNEKE